MRKCDSCLYGEKLYDGTLICQHIVSMQGKEATQDYVICNSVAKCDLFLETNIKCSDCQGSCYAIQTNARRKQYFLICIKHMREAENLSRWHIA